MMLFQHNNTGIHLDSGSTFHLRTNEDDFKEGSLQGIHGGFHYASNVEGRNLYREGIDKVFDYVCKLDTRASNNVNSLSNMVKDGFDVFMDTKRENSFFVTRNGTTWRFGHRNGLYPLVDEPAMVTTMFHDHARGLDNDDVQGYCALQSVEKNKEGFTNKQVKRANVARSGYHMMGAPGAELFKLAIRGNFFKNCPITEEDVNISEKIYGPSVSTIKGKQKQKRPTPKAVVDDWIEMPKELLKHNSNLDLCIDIMFINNVAFFVSIDKAIKFRFSTELKDRTKDAIYKSIDEILRIYNHAEFRIKTIYCDNEFKPVFDDMKDNMDVTMNYAAPGKHEPTIERSNQTLKGLF
ncbi:unnamed protein product [Cylindrotheca closterium]|uniref:Uncharacterized protein n=1 Tax=Cylindrotheca closterium TaxID=2856 RepID=A0AAD2FIX9_9STRA|nr:unnamed protein product [Cylindrotheca closterium]